MNLHHSPLADQLAAEYVLGGLKGAARRRFERLLPAHPALRRAVVAWEQQLNRLAVGSDPVTPPPEIWQGIERRLFPVPPPRAWWNSLSLWRGLALASGLAAVVALAPPWVWSPSAQPMPFAVVRGKQQEVLWTVALAEDGRVHVNNLRAMAMPPDQRCLLWLKTAKTPPVMLGVLPDDGGSRTLAAPPTTTGLSPRGELWVTMEPIHPHPQPPAQPLYHAHWQAL